MGEYTKQEPSSDHQFLCFLSSVAGRVGLLQAGERQEELQERIKIMLYSDKLENCSERNRMQFSSERYAQAGLTEQTGRRILQKANSSEESCGLGWLNKLTLKQMLSCCKKVKRMGMHKQEYRLQGT